MAMLPRTFAALPDVVAVQANAPPAGIEKADTWQRKFGSMWPLPVGMRARLEHALVQGVALLQKLPAEVLLAEERQSQHWSAT